MMKNIVFSTKNIDELVTEVANEVVRKIGMLNTQSIHSSCQPDKLLTIDQLSNELPEHPAKQTIYGWVNNRKIPFEKHGNKLFFRKSLITEWLDNGRQINHLK